MKLVLHWAVTAIALVVAVWLVPGIEIAGNAFVAVGVTAVILGILNTLLRPVLRFLSCAFIVLTLGLFLLVINGFILWLAAYISSRVFGVGFHVNGFWPAFWGGIIVSLVSFVFSLLLEGRDAQRRRRRWA